MINRFFLIISLISPLLLLGQSVNIDAVIDPYPTPFIAEWKQVPGLFNVTVTNNVGNPVTVDLEAEIKKNGEVLGHSSKEIEIDAFGVRTLDNIEYLDLNDWDYQSQLSENIIQTGRLTAGDYAICFIYRKMGDADIQTCVNFEIVIPEIPDLLEPVEDINVAEIFPRFEWTPSFVPSDLTIKYRIILCHNEQNEDPHYSITKVPLLDEITENNSLIYPLNSPPLETGEYYVWQVQLLDENDEPLGENDGKTEIGRFIYGTVAAAGEVVFVNDGVEGDLDWTRDSLVSGNWDGESEAFYYSAGTAAGEIDIVPWTFAGPMTSFTVMNIVPEGSTYYINVKAGEFGDVLSSDGCEIDRTPPASYVNELSDSLQSPFDVKWTAIDAVSGIQSVTIQKKVEDSAFVDWATIEDSTTSKSFTGETGKIYYFQSRAIDGAGNVEAYPDSADTKTYVKKPDDSTYVLVPNVAYLKITDSTKVEKKDGKTTLKGKTKLVIEPTPFDNFEKSIDLSDTTICDSTGMVFKINPATNALEPFEGKINLSDSSGIKKVYKDVFKIVAISFDAKRPSNAKMLVDSAFIVMPFKIPSQGNTNLTSIDSIPITAAGLAFNKDFDKKWSKWGMTFTIKRLALAAEKNPPYIEAKVNVAFNNTSDTTTNFATNATIGFRGKDDIFAHIVPDSIPMRLIPKKDYVMLDSIWFEKPDDEWKLGAALQFKYPSPLDSITDQSKANILIGDDGFDLELALINESRDSTYQKSDKTAFSVTDYFAMDLTNVNLKLQSVQKNGKMALSREHSYVEFMADVYLGKSSPKRIAIGDPDENKKGFKVTFDGDVQQPGFKVKENPFDIGPVRLSGFTEGAGLGITFEPFEISLSGGLGINKPGTFEGTVNFENLKFNKHGIDFSDFQVLGGDVTVMDVITASIDSIGYSAEPTTLTFKEPQGDTTTVDKTIEVDSYFRLAGASLGLNIGGDGGGGGCEEFLLYEKNNNTNVVIREAWFEVKNACRLTADLKYVEDPEPLLSFSGSAELKESGIQGVAIGKIGQRGGQPTFGIFMAASGLNANLGTITLNEVGGGFFYRPLPADIDQVKTLVGLKQGSLMQNDISEIIQDDIPPANNLTFAVMLYAGIYVQSKEVCEANALITLTDNYFELLAKAKMLNKEAEGNLQLLVSWDPAYAEGFVGFKMNRKHVMKVNQTIEFFVYSTEVPGLTYPIWAVMGNGNVDIFPSTLSASLTTEFFLGPPGFFFSVDIEKNYNFWIINGSYGFGTMFWWEKNVSWGAYANVHGSLNLDHVAGISCGLEGALIGAAGDVLIYSVGSFSASFLGETVYSGSIWVSLGTNGVHGGKGRNSTYDGYIESAKNMADNMKDEIEDMTEDIEDAKANAMQMTDEQRYAAGETLYNIVGDDNLADITDIKNMYQNDMNNYRGPNNNLRNAFNNYIFFNEVQQLKNRREEIEGDSVEIDSKLATLQSNSDILINRFNNYTSRVTATLPQLAETIALSNPVDTGQVITVTIDGHNTEIPVNTNIDGAVAQQNVSNTTSMRSDIIAYKDSMLAQSESLIDDLVFADSLLYTGNVSVNSLSLDYYRYSHKLSENSADYIGYYEKMKRTYGSKSVDMLLVLKTAMEQDMNAQNFHLPENKIEELIDIRIGIINYLLTKAGKPEFTKQAVNNMDLEEKKDYCFMLGLEVWYNIPLNGMQAITNNTVDEINNFTNNFDVSRNRFFDSWASLGTKVETIHNVKAQSYEYLYNFYDDLSWEFEDGGPNANANNAPPNMGGGYQFGGQVYNNFNGLPGGLVNLNNMGNGGNAGNFGGLPGGQIIPGGQQHEPIVDQQMLLGLRLGTAAKRLRNFDTFSAKREYVGGISTPPSINHFNVAYSSEEETYGYYGILTLNYEAEHATGGCFYNIDISDYTPGPISLGVGRQPSFYFFRDIEPAGNYNIQLSAFANTGYKIKNSINLGIDYFSIGVDEHEGGEIHTDATSDDDTKPTKPVFSSAYYSNSDNELVFEYIADDPESGIAEYQYAIADSVWYEFISLAAPPQRKINYVRTFASTGGRTENQVKGLDFDQSAKYYILGKVKNGAGMWSSIGISDPIVVDKTPPSKFKILDFQVTTESTKKHGKRYRLTADWENAHDPESEVLYVVGLGTGRGKDDLVSFGPVYNNQSSIEQIFVYTKKMALSTVHLTVRAINSSGLSVQSTQSRNLQQKRGK